MQAIYNHSVNNNGTDNKVHQFAPKGGEKDILRMSLSSTLSAGLDIGDLSSVWNRKEGSEAIDEAISREITQKYAMNHWLTFLDKDIEEEFIEKFFYGALQTHRVFMFVVPAIYLAFVAYTFIEETPIAVLILHFVLGGGTFSLYFLSKSRHWRSIHFHAMVFVVLYNVIGLGIERQYKTSAVLHEHELQENDSRSMFIVLNFGHVATLMAIRFPFKVSIALSVIFDISLFIQMIFLENMEPWDYLENFTSICITKYAIAGASYANEKRHRNQEVRRAGILKHTEEVAKEKLITEKLLLNILPTQIARRLMDTDEVISDSYTSATVLFADLVGWTDISHSMEPVEAIQLLNEIVSAFDRLTFMHKLEKIKTIGDAYLVACGLPEAMDAKQSSHKMASFALDMLKALKALSGLKKRNLDIAIGMHTGPVVAGVIGKTKFLYDLWGDSVNTASRMQSHGDTNKIHVTSTVYDLLETEFEFEKRPIIEVKGKGPMQTYFLVGKKENATQEAVTRIEDEGVVGFGQPSTDKVEEGTQDKSVNSPRDSDVGEENKGVKESRNKRKAREAIMKRNQELDAQMDQQIKGKMKIMWYFVDENLEKQFVGLQKSMVIDHFFQITIMVILVEMVLGIYMVRFDMDDMRTYYIVMGIVACVQAINGGICYMKRDLSFVLNIVNLFLANAGNVVLFAIFRSNESPSIRLTWIYFIILSAVTFMSCHIPYQIANNMANAIFVSFLAVLFSINLDNGFDLLGVLMFSSFSFFCFVTMNFAEKHARREFLLSHLADEERSRVIRQREESERLLHNILPESVIRKMREGNGKLVDTYHNASVMFADIVGFTVLSSKLDARSIVTMLNKLFSQVDEVAERKGLEKIKTIGDAYMVVAGLPYPREDHAKVAVEMALEMVKIVQELPEIEGLRVNVRIGVHSGNVVGGIIGASKMVFDIWGENVNVASKMESNGTPGCVNVSHVTRELVGEGQGISFEKREKQVLYHGKEYNLYYARWSGGDGGQKSEVEAIKQTGKDW